MHMSQRQHMKSAEDKSMFCTLLVDANANYREALTDILYAYFPLIDVVEASNGAVKRRLEQHLLLRGSRDFESVEAWQALIDEVLRKSNQTKRVRVEQELSSMPELNVGKLADKLYRKLTATLNRRRIAVFFKHDKRVQAQA